MLKLRRGTVVALDPLTVEVEGQRRLAWADPALVGEPAVGDEVVVNTVALDLGLGSGGFDIVHVNLTRGLSGGKDGDEHVIKLNYSSLQHPVDPVEALGGEYAPDEVPEPAATAIGPRAGAAGEGGAGRAMPVLVLPLHGHLAPAVFAAARARPGLTVGFIQATGGAMPGRLSRDVGELRERGLLREQITAGGSWGGDREAVTLAGALEAARTQLGWDLAVVGPGPGILGSATRLGHGGMAALDAAHTALALGLETVISPRLSQSDPRPRHRGLSHHTATVLELLLAPVTVALPEAEDEILADVARRKPRYGGSHRAVPAPVDLDAYLDAGLPRRTMGRDASEDALFFSAPLAAGRVAAEAAGR